MARHALTDQLHGTPAGHRALRRDTARFIAALGRLDARDGTTPVALHRYATAAVAALHRHRIAVEEILWPALRERRPSFGALEQQLQAEHEVLADAGAAVTTATDRLLTSPASGREAARREAELAAVRLRAVLVEHLDAEEAVLPLLQAAFTSDDLRSLDRRVIGRFPPLQLGVDVGWHLDAAPPHERAVRWSTLPRHHRLLHHLVLRPRVRRLSAVLAPPPSMEPHQEGPTMSRTSRTSRTIRTTATAEVTADPTSVWDLVSDIHRYAEWVHGTAEVLDGDPIARPGAVYRERNRVVGPITSRSSWRVAEADPDRGHQRHESDGMPGVPRFAVLIDIEPTTVGTRLALTLEGRVEAGPVTGPLARSLERVLSTGNEISMQALVGLLEDRPVSRAVAP
jgi:hypothetical protein